MPINASAATRAMPLAEASFMARFRTKKIEASDTQKTILIALAEGWRLRLAHQHGWCLFQPGRARPFAQLKTRAIDKMTAAGWLTAGVATKGLAFLPEKVLTLPGRKYAEKLIASRWAEDHEWLPYHMPDEESDPTYVTFTDSLAA